jgi:hypothetical protein
MFVSNEIKKLKIIDNQTITASGSYTSSAIDLRVFRPAGYFSLQVEVTGDGTAKLEYLVSNNEKDYIDPVGAEDIFSGFTKTSGNGSDGKDLQEFHPPGAKSMKIKATETGGVNSVTVSAWLFVQ